MAKCPQCVSGWLTVRLKTTLYVCGWYNAVRRCQTCNGTGTAPFQGIDGKTAAAGKD